MKKDNTNNRKPVRTSHLTYYTLGLFTLAAIIFGVIVSPPISIGDNPYNSNSTTEVKLNITNVAPQITNVLLWGNSTYEYGEISKVYLQPGYQSLVWCNFTVSDNNGASDVNKTNATIFYIDSTTDIDSDDNLSAKYTNNSCVRGTTYGSYNVTYTCSFMVHYFAHNGTWTCYAFATDQEVSGNISTGRNASNATLYPLLALNSTNEVNFGEVTSGQNTTVKTANFSNIGNVPLDLDLYVYGRIYADNWSFVCDDGNNITSGRLYYNLTNSTSIGNFSPVPNGTGALNTLDFVKAVATNGSQTSVYFRADVPTGIRGRCNGTLVFGAVAT